MTKHTPGPWFVVQSDNATPHIMTEPGSASAMPGNDKLVCVMPVEITRDYNSLNNARLIAAAPDLLAALHGMVEEFRDDNPDNDWAAVKRGIAAIAKVTTH